MADEKSLAMSAAAGASSVLLLVVIFTAYTNNSSNDDVTHLIHTMHQDSSALPQTYPQNTEVSKWIPVLSKMPALRDTLHKLFPTDPEQFYGFCYNLPQPDKKGMTSFPADFQKKREAVFKQIKDLSKGVWVEGSSSWNRFQDPFYFLLASEPWVKNVCEIGFNQGHSAYYWLAASPDNILQSFDLGSHPYVAPTAKLFNETVFPGRVRQILGDSNKTVPLAGHLHGKCDLLIVDGGHTSEQAEWDTTNMMKLANPQHHLLIMDDSPIWVKWEEGPTKGWLRAQTKGQINHLYGCTVDKGFMMGFTLGYYRL